MSKSIFTSAADLKEIVGEKIRVNGERQEVVKVSWKSKQVKLADGTVVSADDIVRRGRGFAVADAPAKPTKKAAESAKKDETETEVVRGRNRKPAKEETKAVNKEKATKPEPKIEEKAMSKSIFNSAADLKEIVGKPLTVNGEKRDGDNKRIRVAAVSWKKQQVKLTDGDVVAVADIYRKGAGFFADTGEVAAKPVKKADTKVAKPVETPELFASAKELKELVGKPLTVNGEKRDGDNHRIRVSAVSWNKQQVKLTNGDVIAVADIYKKGVGYFADTEEETEKVRKKADKPAGAGCAICKSRTRCVCAAKPKRKQVEEDLDEDLDDEPVRIPRGGEKVRKKAEKEKVRKSKKESPEDKISEAIGGIVDLADEWIPRGFKLAANGAEFNKDGLVVVHLSLVPSKMKAAEVEALLNSYSEAEKEDELEEYADEFEEDVDLIDEDELEEDFDEEDEDDLEDEDEDDEDDLEDEDEDDEDDLEDEDEGDEDEDEFEDEDEDEDDEDEDEDDEDEFEDEDDFDI